MFGNLFATYNIVDPPSKPAKTQEYVEEPKSFNDYYRQFIPQIIQQQQDLPDDIVPPDQTETELPDPNNFQINIPNEEPDVQPDLSQNIVGTARQFVGWKYISGGKNPNARKVICTTTGDVFPTAKEGGEWCGLKTVAKAAKNRGKAGKHPISGVGLYWMYYDEWLELQNNN